MPKAKLTDYFDDIGLGEDPQSAGASKISWHSAWIAWHYAAISLTHQDALLTTGIVEYSLPTALSSEQEHRLDSTSSNVSTASWELGKPRAKQHRDVYADRDVTRIVCKDQYLQESSILNINPGRQPRIGNGADELASNDIDDP